MESKKINDLFTIECLGDGKPTQFVHCRTRALGIGCRNIEICWNIIWPNKDKKLPRIRRNSNKRDKR